MIKINITEQDVKQFNNKYFAEHPRAKKKRIERPIHPSLNWYLTANNLKVNTVKQSWKEFIIFILENNGLTNQAIDYKCDVVYKVYCPTRNIPDVDNVTPKFIFDGLVAGNFFTDDNPKYIKRLTIEVGYDKENPRTEIIVKEYKESNNG